MAAEATKDANDKMLILSPGISTLKMSSQNNIDQYNLSMEDQE